MRIERGAITSEAWRNRRAAAFPRAVRCGAVAVAATLAVLPSPARAASDPRALAVAERLEAAMGGRQNLDSHPYLTFRFIVERDGKAVADWFHAWDRTTGRYRLEGTREGKKLLVLFNVNSKKGEARLDGSPLDPGSAASQLEFAYGRYINDSYWLLMPWKWRDPGVTLGYEGERTLEGKTYEVVTLAFEQVGLTPNDRYWGFVAKDTGLLERWEFILQDDKGEPGNGSPSAFTWEEWTEVGGGLRLSLRKVKQGDGPAFTIRFTEVRFEKAADEAAFTP